MLIELIGMQNTVAKFNMAKGFICYKSDWKQQNAFKDIVDFQNDWF